MTKSSHASKTYAVALFTVALILTLTNAVAAQDWWDPEWYYRIDVQVNSTSYQRTDWPVEILVDFTSLLSQVNETDPLDYNSTRVVEYNSTGGVLYEVTSQFDRADGYNASNNATGTIVFLLNGTTNADNVRYFQIYFDTITRNKSVASYPSNLSATWDGEELFVNNTVDDIGLLWYIDTIRGENTSGIYRIRDSFSNEILTIPGGDERTIEYTEFNNGTHNMTFDFRNNVTFKHQGPVRIVVEQEGNESVWNDLTNKTEGYIKKTYTFYLNNQWVKVNQNFTNFANYSIQRNSTPAGALTLEVTRAALDWTYDGNATEPGSWWWFASEFASSHIGIINLNHTGNFSAVNRNDTDGRTGIELQMTTIDPNESITDISVIHVNPPSNINGGPSPSQVEDLRDRLITPENITRQDAQQWQIGLDITTQFSTYNRGEDIIINANITGDEGNLVDLVNATLKTASGDNITVQLYDDGTNGDNTSDDKVFTGYYNFTSTSTLGSWNVTARAYTDNGFFLNENSTNITVSDQYNVDNTIINPNGLINRIINATITVLNIRSDTFITDANISCLWSGNPLYNYSNQGNGTYNITFQSAAFFGTFNLNCTANATGNIGSGLDTFTTEDTDTDITLDFEFVVANFTADNVTAATNQTFEAFINATNTGNGTAFNPNVTLTLPTNWTSNVTFASFDDIVFNTSSTLGFLITIASDTPPENYTMNFTLNWTDPGGAGKSLNLSQNVTVDENPVIDVLEGNISAVINRGLTQIIGNFTVKSIGNANITTITFNATGLNMTLVFEPQNITTLGVNQNASIRVNATVPANHSYGIFIGTVNASALNDASDTINVTVEVPGTNLSLFLTPQNFVADNVTWYEFQNYTLGVNATNVGNATATNVNITLTIPANWTTNVTHANNTNHTLFCGDLLPGEICTVHYNISITQSVPADYVVNATVTWINPTIGIDSNQSNSTVTVQSNPLLRIEEDLITGNGDSDNETIFGNFTLRGYGNDQVTELNYTIRNLSNFDLKITPNLTNISEGENRSLQLNITVPQGFPSGLHFGILNISSGNNGWDSVILNVTIPIKRTWELIPRTCQAATFNDTGTVCAVMVNNTGNEEINFTINPEEKNNSNVNVTQFNVTAQSTYMFGVFYNVSGIPKLFYNATFHITANQSSDPQNRTLDIALLPFANPEITLGIDNTSVEQKGSITILANVSDPSQGGIQYTTVTVQRPNGINDSINMTLTGILGDNTHQYFAEYPGVWGDTNETGYYNISAYAIDAAEREGAGNGSSFYVFVNLTATVTTGFQDYYLGESGSIIYNITDAVGNPLVVNTTIFRYDSDNNVRQIEHHQTNSEGKITIVPTFNILSDVPLGNHTLNSSQGYYDAVLDTTINSSNGYTFRVLERYENDFETAIVWYPESIMTFYVLLSTDNNIQEPTDMELTVYDPAQAVYLNVGIGSFSVVNQTSTSILYRFPYSMPLSTSTGFYLADLSIRQGTREENHIESFRVSSGGPYDVVIRSVTAEAEQGESQDFTLLLMNMGDVSQDVFLDYWIQDSSSIYSSISGEAVFVAAGENVTIDRSLPIFSSQATGTYTLNVKMSYSTIQPDIQTNQTFLVIEPVPEPETPSGGTSSSGGGGGRSAGAGGSRGGGEVVVEERLEVLNVFPRELFIERGGLAYVTIEVKNTGFEDAFRITGQFEGIPSEWTQLIREISVLPEGAVGYLIVKIEVPEFAEARLYNGELTILTPEFEETQDYRIEVFESKEELLRSRIRRMEELIQRYELEAEELAQQGKDVTRIFGLLQKTNNFVIAANNYLIQGRLIEATEALDEGVNALEEIRYRLPLIREPRPTIVEVVPRWIYILIGAILVGSILGLFVLKRSIKVFRQAVSRRLFAEEKPKKKEEKEKIEVAEPRHKEEKEEPTKQKQDEKLDNELAKTLKKQFDEGLISEEAYGELLEKYK